MSGFQTLQLNIRPMEINNQSQSVLMKYKAGCFELTKRNLAPSGLITGVCENVHKPSNMFNVIKFTLLHKVHLHLVYIFFKHFFSLNELSSCGSVSEMLFHTNRSWSVTADAEQFV